MSRGPGVCPRPVYREPHRPRQTCTCCERFVQAPLPSRPIERGRPGPGLLAHVPPLGDASIACRATDGSAGFGGVSRSGTIREVACMAHIRRKVVDLHRLQGSPIAEEAVGRNSMPSKKAPEVPRQTNVPNCAEPMPPPSSTIRSNGWLEQWLAIQLTTISGEPPLAQANLRWPEHSDMPWPA